VQLELQSIDCPCATTSISDVRLIRPRISINLFIGHFSACDILSYAMALCFMVSAYCVYKCRCDLPVGALLASECSSALMRRSAETLSAETVRLQHMKYMSGRANIIALGVYIVHGSRLAFASSTDRGGSNHEHRHFSNHKRQPSSS